MAFSSLRRTFVSSPATAAARFQRVGAKIQRAFNESNYNVVKHYWHFEKTIILLPSFLLGRDNGLHRVSSQKLKMRSKKE
jgi:hypothetical protein